MVRWQGVEQLREVQLAQEDQEILDFKLPPQILQNTGARLLEREKDKA